MTVEQLATLVLEACDVGDIPYVVSLCLSALEDDNRPEPADDDEDCA